MVDRNILRHFVKEEKNLLECLTTRTYIPLNFERVQEVIALKKIASLKSASNYLYKGKGIVLDNYPL